MKWNRTKPTKRGLYWYLKPNGKVACVKVCRQLGQLRAVLLRHRGNRTPNSYLVSCMGGWWFGPLPNPFKLPLPSDRSLL